MSKLYIVQPNDTLAQIVARECPGASWRQVALDNEIRNPDLIFVGQQLNLNCVPIIPDDTPASAADTAHLVVPFYSQEDQDAKRSGTDCGPTSLRMVIGWKRLASGQVDIPAPTVDDIWDGLRDAHGNPIPPGQFISMSQLRSISPQYNLTLIERLDATTEVIQEEIDAGRPVIMLCHYGSYTGSMSPFKGGHILVVVGYSPTHIIVNDPLWWGTLRSGGDGRHILRREFEAAIDSSNTKLDGNPGNVGLFVQP